MHDWYFTNLEISFRFFFRDSSHWIFISVGKIMTTQKIVGLGICAWLIFHESRNLVLFCCSSWLFGIWVFYYVILQQGYRWSYHPWYQNIDTGLVTYGMVTLCVVWVITRHVPVLQDNKANRKRDQLSFLSSAVTIVRNGRVFTVFVRLTRPRFRLFCFLTIPLPLLIIPKLKLSFQKAWASDVVCDFSCFLRSEEH